MLKSSNGSAQSALVEADGSFSFNYDPGRYDFYLMVKDAEGNEQDEILIQKDYLLEEGKTQTLNFE